VAREKFVQKYLTGPALLEMGGNPVYQELTDSILVLLLILNISRYNFL
jgi:hypothetical protein